jgi:uncharacterized protein YprB with RNaseH-like and TPR domain
MIMPRRFISRTNALHRCDDSLFLDSMLKHTFCHIPGFGPGTERSLWKSGLSGWDKLAAHPDLPLSAKKQAALHAHIRESTAQLQAGNADYFYRLLPSAEQWRLFANFRHQVAYFDIETTGLGDPQDYITTIVLYDGHNLRAYVQGQNLDDFARDIAAYRLLVTYNGKTFDAPFVRRCLGAPLDQPHIDLRYVLGSLGYRGGLKGCEQQLGIPRQGLEDVDGFFAVLLWHDYQRGNPKALDTLLAYNALDVINLESLMVIAYNAKLADTPLGRDAHLPASARPPLPFDADQPTIRRLKAQHGLRPF